MGHFGEHQLLEQLLHSNCNMKAFILLFALVAAISAEEEAADVRVAAPGILYHGFHLPYAYYGYPYAYYGLHGGCTNNAGQLVPCAYGRKKREAEADPQVLLHGFHLPYAYPWAYQVGYHGWGVKNAPCVNALNQAVPCAQDGEARKKREADANYYAVPHWPYGHALVHTSHFGVCLNYKGEQVPC